jgi:anti-sigma B factor antagonist
MNINFMKKNNVSIISIREERVDAHNSDALKDKLKSIFEAGGKNILVDLRDVRFIDSSGLGALVSGYKNAISHQGTLKLAGLQTQVQSMFELTRLHRVFDIYPTTEDAMDSY